MDSLDNLRKLLKTGGRSLTAARSTVFNALLHQEPMTMHKLVEHCTGIDRASVYRTVALFERMGVVQRLQTGWKYKLELADIFHNHHHHVTCLQCGHVAVLPEDASIERRLRNLANKVGYSPSRHQVELQGYCSDCQKAV